MGKYNSSTYRVVPLMEHIKNNLERISQLLSLFNISVKSLPNEYFYGDNEKLLKPSLDHLINLVDYLGRAPLHKEKNASGNRFILFSGSPTERKEKAKEAIGLLKRVYPNMNSNTKAWYIFEGYTHPDIFIEGEDYIILAEGKWTEREITTHTEHLLENNGEYRNQMIRHIQATLNYSSKKIYAFYLVDEECGYLDDLTKESFEKQLDKETITLSFDNKKRIKEDFYGYSTWQDIENIFPSIRFLSRKEIDDSEAIR